MNDKSLTALITCIVFLSLIGLTITANKICNTISSSFTKTTSITSPDSIYYYNFNEGEEYSIEPLDKEDSILYIQSRRYQDSLTLLELTNQLEWDNEKYVPLNRSKLKK